MDYECAGCGKVWGRAKTFAAHIRDNPTCRAAQFAAVVEQAKAEVLDDIAAGAVPATVAGFSDLHDHVDANAYGGAFDLWYEGAAGDDWFVEFWNQAQGAVDAWLKAGRPKAWVCPSCGKKTCDGYCTVDNWEPGIGFDR